MNTVAIMFVSLAGVVLVLIGVSIYLVRIGKLEASDWLENSLGIPKGSVRAMLAILILFIVIWSAIEGVEIETPPDWLIGILGTIIGFYFGTKGLGTRRGEDIPAKIERLKGLLDAGALTQDEFDRKKSELLAKL